MTDIEKAAIEAAYAAELQRMFSVLVTEIAEGSDEGRSFNRFHAGVDMLRIIRSSVLDPNQGGPQ